MTGREVSEGATLFPNAVVAKTNGLASTMILIYFIYYAVPTEISFNL